MSNSEQWRILAVCVALAAPTAAFSQPLTHSDSPPSVIVAGAGTASRAADWTQVTGVVRAQAKDQQTALRLMSAKQDAITAGLSRLAGAKGVRIEAGDLSFAPILPAGCRDQDQGEDSPMARTKAPISSGKCAPTGVEGSLKLTATVHPAGAIGDLASLAVQLGAEDVQMGESGVDDQADLQTQAARAAYDQALAQARLLASAAGEHLGRLLRLNRGGPDQNGPRYRYSEFSDEAVKMDLLRPPPIVPDVALKLTPPKVTENSWVVVEFELVK